MSDVVIHLAQVENTVVPWRRSLRAVAAVAGVFCLVVLAILLVTLVEDRRGDPLELRVIERLKAQLVDLPADDVLKERLRQADLSIRRAHFMRMAFVRHGAYLLLGGVLLSVGCARVASGLKQAHYLPDATIPRDHGWAATIRRGRAGMVGAAALLAGTALAFTLLPATLPAPIAAPIEAAGPALPATNAAASADDWPRFRGPAGNGVAVGNEFPTMWDAAAGKNILWSSAVPLAGNSSPVVCAGRVYLTGGSESRREVYCFDADSGELKWTTAVPGPAPAMQKDVAEAAGYASPTATADGKHVVAIFPTGELLCLKTDGTRLWNKSLGVPDNQYGHAASPIIWKGLVIVPLDQSIVPTAGKSVLLALDLETGKQVWQVKRNVPESWTTPAILERAGTTQLITAANPWVISYNPATGEEIWRAKCLTGEVTPSPAVAGDVVFAGVDGADLVAIKPDGKGDVSKSHVLWKASDGLPDIVSPVAGGGLVFLAMTDGNVTCVDAGTGKTVWQETVDAQFHGSPALAGEKLYLTDRKGTTHVLQAGRKYHELAANPVGEGVETSPALAGGRIYIRGEKHLFCIGARR